MQIYGSMGIIDVVSMSRLALLHGDCVGSEIRGTHPFWLGLGKSITKELEVTGNCTAEAMILICEKSEVSVKEQSPYAL